IPDRGGRVCAASQAAKKLVSRHEVSGHDFSRADKANRINWALDRFQNSRALAGIVQGGIFLRKMPLESIAFGVQLFWNRYSPALQRGVGATNQQHLRSPVGTA